jgi:biopolymer transport protein ExbD
MAVQVQKESALAALRLTPLIDVVFLLLIFFLVATKFAEEERELEVQLPEASEAKPLTTKPGELFINIDAEGQYFVTNEALDLQQLYDVLITAWVNNPAQASVIIRADKNCRWEPIVAAMNCCQKANIRDYRVDTRPAGG